MISPSVVFLSLTLKAGFLIPLENINGLYRVVSLDKPLSSSEFSDEHFRLVSEMARSQCYFGAALNKLICPDNKVIDAKLFEFNASSKTKHSKTLVAVTY